MAELAISKEFLAAYGRLQRSVQRAVDAAISKFSEHTHAGLHLEKLQGAFDSRIRTMRVNQFYRGVVLALGGRDYVLLTVMPHDDAIAYAVSRLFTVNQTFGVLEVRDQSRLEELTATTPVVTPAGLFDRVSDADLRRLGIEVGLLPLIRAITDDKQLESLANVLPSTQYTVLTGLGSGIPADEVWAELAERIVAGADADDLVGAARRTPERIKFVSGPHELASILAHPFDVWRTFLHPTQRDIAQREVYGGPVLVTGSAGTGKTVTGLHRAVYLASRMSIGDARILVTTFTRTLADALQSQLRLLAGDQKIRDHIEVISVDRLAHQVVKTARNRQPKIADEVLVRHVFETAGRGAAGSYSAAFLRREWEQVILAQGLATMESYRDAPRRGQGEGLRAVQREQVWFAIASAVAELDKLRRQTHLQLAVEAATIAELADAARYQHIIVDEGQDLHPAQWRMLRALVSLGANDMFILADPHQRIYDSQVSLASLGIEVRGRSRRLTVNYRTTHEILDWSVKVLTGAVSVGLDDAVDSLSGYRSITHGRPPVVVAHRDRVAEYRALIEHVGTWLEQGVEPHAIGVAARTNHLVDVIATTLSDAHIPVADEANGRVGVYVATMHRMKGLEFQCLAVVGLDSAVLPAANAVTDIAEDPLSHKQDLQRERCLLFVAVTRARDVLYLSHAGPPSSLLPA